MATETKSKPKRSAPSRYKGVAWDRAKAVWTASIKVDDTTYPLGSFATKIGAAAAYDLTAKRLFGNYAILNFPQLYSSTSA